MQEATATSRYPMKALLRLIDLTQTQRFKVDKDIPKVIQLVYIGFNIGLGFYDVCKDFSFAVVLSIEFVAFNSYGIRSVWLFDP